MPGSDRSSPDDNFNLNNPAFGDEDGMFIASFDTFHMAGYAIL
jgi:hypothetical protein